MARPNMDIAMEHLLATLNGIKGQAPYLTSVEKVEQKHREAHQIGVHELPYVGARESDEVFEGYMGMYKCRFPVEILMQVVGDDETQAKHRCNLLYNDIIHALNVDYTRGGSGYETVMIQGAPTELFDRTKARKVLLVEVWYTRNFTNEFNGGMP